MMVKRDSEVFKIVVNNINFKVRHVKDTDSYIVYPRIDDNTILEKLLKVLNLSKDYQIDYTEPENLRGSKALRSRSFIISKSKKK